VGHSFSHDIRIRAASGRRCMALCSENFENRLDKTVLKIMIAPSLLRAISAVVIALTFFAITMSYTAGQMRDDSAPEWTAQNVSTVPAELLPISRPDPDFPEQDYISYKHSNWAITTSREYAFSLMRRSNEGPGPLRYYWVAKVTLPTAFRFSLSWNDCTSYIQKRRSLKLSLR
jgi:hypothetical protein